MKFDADYLVIGSGIAGLSFALLASKLGKVAVVTKRSLSKSTTAYAQGGIAAAIEDDDNPKIHMQDTIDAGAGLCDVKVVRMVTEEGPKAVRQLIEWGTKFSRNKKGELDLTLEGGHSKRRVAHSNDMTGEEIERSLTEAVRKNKNISCYENHIAIDLITEQKLKLKKNKKNRCLGAYVLDIGTGEIHTFATRNTILASGGAGKVYLYTSNPDVSSGDGVAMASRAGAAIKNLEFVQFHPSCLYHPLAKSFLISEALRGEGAKLKLKDGSEFMHKYDKRKELATRDIVARAIDHELKKSGDDFVYLDISHKESSFVRERFPKIYKTCLEFGIDITKESIPVVPAAHYFCGGVEIDIEGKTSIEGLFACGEVACSGFHGANRLASNSLLESLVFAMRIAKYLEEHDDQKAPPKIPRWDTLGTTDSDEEVIIKQNWDEIRRMMWNYVGIVRSNKRLKRAQERIALIRKEIKEYYWNFKVTSNLIELRNLALVADLIIQSALKRKESRGLHYNIDYPNLNDKYLKI
ncbi:MAG: L-aspartate oxidase [Pseudomonadota bacterium]